MIRTIISLNKEDKDWLTRYSDRQSVSMAEAIRRAIKSFKRETKSKPAENVLTRTSGIWKTRKIDALNYVSRLRKEW